MSKASVLALAVALLTTACGDDGPTGGTASSPPDRLDLALVDVVAGGLKEPTFLTAPVGDDRLFVLEKNKGLIRIVAGGELAPEPFLDLSAALAARGDGDARGRAERGLLTMAFHPDYAANGRFFVYYADGSGVSELVEYRVSGDPDRADPASAVLLRSFGPTIRHYGGTLAFAPDGMLWLSVGDGSRPQDAADVAVPRGGILRLDVSTPGTAVGAPGNPFAADGSADLWAIGLRNPWRWSIDPADGLLYVADVGDKDREEISVQPAGVAGIDYGWPTLEGTRCVTESCDAAGTAVPVLELEHPASCSVIGGYVYRGEEIPALAGTYFHSDFCGGWLRSFRFVDGAATEQYEWFDQIGPVTSFGLDGFGELYVVSIDGRIRKVVSAG